MPFSSAVLIATHVEPIASIVDGNQQLQGLYTFLVADVVNFGGKLSQNKDLFC